jgi:hypothetical protein
VRGVCPDCGACVPITETGEWIPGTNRATYKTITPHPDERIPSRVIAGMVIESQCTGTSKKV